MSGQPSPSYSYPPPPPGRPSPSAAPNPHAGSSPSQATYQAPVDNYSSSSTVAAASPSTPSVAFYQATALKNDLGSNEAYGQVQTPGAMQSLTHRVATDNYSPTVTTTQSSPSYYGGAGASYSTQSSSASPSYSSGHNAPFTYLGATGGTSADVANKPYYKHNSTALAFLVPPLALMLWRHQAPYPLHIFLFVALILYSFDLANLRYALEVAVWVGVFVVSVTTGWFTLLDEGDDDSGILVLELMSRITIQIFLLCCCACWVSLQFRWLHVERPDYSVCYEQFLHAVLPVVAAGLLCFQLTSLLFTDFGMDNVAIFAPYIFAVILATGMLWLGCCPSSFQESDSNKNSKDGHSQSEPKYVITKRLSKVHSILLLFVPPLMYVTIFFRRIWSRYASFDELFDLVLAWSVPYLLHYGINLLHQSGTWEGPYHLTNILFPASGVQNLRGALVPVNVTILASLALQNRYLIPICHNITYQFQGHDVSSSFVVSNYLSAATISIWFGIWIWGRKSTVSGEPLFGEYHEDIIQLSFALCGFFIGMALGLPWSLLPLPILALLGASLWVTTRLMRYLAVFLFVVHAAAVVLFGYRYAGMDMKINLAIPSINLGLVRFGMLIVVTSIIVGFIAGLSVRSSGGYGAAFLRKIDLNGKLLVLYSVLITALECTLITQPVPKRELSGIELDITDIESNEMLYEHQIAFVTSAVLIGISLFLKQYQSISPSASAVSIACAIGKAVAVFIDYNEDFTSTAEMADDRSDGILDSMFFQAMATMALLVIIVSPKAFLQPLHVKTSMRAKRSYFSKGRAMVEIPKDAERKIIVYAGVLLPLSLLFAVPYVLFPFMKALSKDYYTTAPPITDLIGYALSIWGVACLHMLNYYLPDAGGETWKKVAACTFMMGTGIIFAAPSIPDWIYTGVTASSTPYAHISSLGLQIINRAKTRTGGWGILSASVATLLAVTGPLELRERKSTSGKKDNFFLARIMIFSVMFGCGVSWFIIMQSMSEENFLVLLVCCIACLSVSFFGTITTVLGLFIEIEEFEETEQVAQVWMVAFPVLLFLSGLPQFFIDEASHPFGAGGWLSTYLGICTMNLLSFTLVLRSRSSKNKATRGLGNLSCVTAWACAILTLYGRYGIAGLDANFDVTTLFGIPISVVGTFVAAMMLLLLDGEVVERRSARIQKISSPGQKKSASSAGIGINLQKLNKSTMIIPPLLGSIFVLLLASLYAITLRGSGFLSFGGYVVRSHNDLFSQSFKDNAATKGTSIENNLAQLAGKTIFNSRALIVSAKLAGTGFWTSKSFFNPLFHLGGVAAVIPTIYLIISQMWIGNPISKSQITLMLPLNSIPLLLCRGIPSLQAAAFIGVVAGLSQLWQVRHQDWQSKMRI